MIKADQMEEVEKVVIVPDKSQIVNVMRNMGHYFGSAMSAIAIRTKQWCRL